MLNDFFHWDIFNLSLIGYNRDFFNHTVHWLIFANLFLLCYVFNFLLGNVLNFYSINSKQITFTKIIKKNIIIKIIYFFFNLFTAHIQHNSIFLITLFIIQKYSYKRVWFNAAGKLIMDVVKLIIKAAD